MNTPQYAICAAWLARAYKTHRNPYTLEKSNEHIRYKFFLGKQATPFYQLYVTKAACIIIEQTRRSNGEMYTSRIGYPIMLEGDDTLRRWTGETWSLEPTYATFVWADMSLFDLYLSRGPAGILWERVQ